jgi:hypothetical protein
VWTRIVYSNIIFFWVVPRRVIITNQKKIISDFHNTAKAWKPDSKFVSVKYKGDMTVEKAFEFNQQDPSRKEIAEEL